LILWAEEGTDDLDEFRALVDGEVAVCKDDGLLDEDAFVDSGSDTSNYGRT
jgi:hypothetical protein